MRGVQCSLIPAVYHMITAAGHHHRGAALVSPTSFLLLVAITRPKCSNFDCDAEPPKRVVAIANGVLPPAPQTSHNTHPINSASSDDACCDASA
eukprot:3343648-Pyramimonas_sp.AAC.1